MFFRAKGNRISFQNFFIAVCIAFLAVYAGRASFVMLTVVAVIGTLFTLLRVLDC